LNGELQFPLIVKPNSEGSAKGIWASSVVCDPSALRSQIRLVSQMYGQPVLVEEYIEGKELSVGILGTDKVLPVMEIDFSRCEPSGEFFYSWRMKEFQGSRSLFLNPQLWCPARLEPTQAQAIQSVAWKAARVLDCNDVACIDIRLSSEGIPYLLEINPLPDLDPEQAILPLMARAAGIPYAAFIHKLLQLALQRYSMSAQLPILRRSYAPKRKVAARNLFSSNKMKLRAQFQKE
jgi:D-alanine-D-alanine ligase